MQNLKSKNNGIVTFPFFSQFPEIIHGISTRQFGAIKRRGKIQLKNLEKFAGAISADINTLVFMNQVHGNHVEVVQKRHKQVFANCDGLVTRQKNVYLGVVTADCMPIVFYDPMEKVIGVAHAGYKGLLGGIVQEVVASMQGLGSNAREIRVGIGPSIGVCCYSVTGSRVENFENKYSFLGNYYQKRGNNLFLNLKKVAQQILKRSGIGKGQIETLSYCTSCNNDRFYSYRKDSAKTYGEFVTLVGIT